MYETHSSSLAAETVTGPIVFVHGSLSSRHMWASYPAALGSRSASPAAALLQGQGDLLTVPDRGFYALGAGSNLIPVDPVHDLVVVLRWIQRSALDGFFTRLRQALKA